MARNDMLGNPKSLLVLVACVCFAVAVLTAAAVFGPFKIGSGTLDWTDLGLFFGFLSFIL